MQAVSAAQHRQCSTPYRQCSTVQCTARQVQCTSTLSAAVPPCIVGWTTSLTSRRPEPPLALRQKQPYAASPSAPARNPRIRTWLLYCCAWRREASAPLSAGRNPGTMPWMDSDKMHSKSACIWQTLPCLPSWLAQKRCRYDPPRAPVGWHTAQHSRLTSYFVTGTKSALYS